MGWASFLKAALRVGGRATKATVTTMGSAVLHPQQTLRGMGTATKSAVVGGSLGDGLPFAARGYAETDETSGMEGRIATMVPKPILK